MLGATLEKLLFILRNLLFILLSFSLLSCSNSSKKLPLQKVTITKYQVIKDSAEIVSILNKTEQKHETKIDYHDFVGKLFRVTFLNNSNETIYLLKPLLEEASDSIFKNFTASIHLIQVSKDSLKWENVFYRRPVDIYDADYDTLKPKSTISKITFIDNNQKSKYLKLLLEYRSDTSYFRDTIQITNLK